jgi:hypothetical protein
MNDEKAAELIIRHSTMLEVQAALNKDVQKELGTHEERIVALEKKLIVVAMLASGGGAALSQLLFKVL